MPKITPVHWRDFEKFLLHCGAYLDRIHGDHRIYKKAGCKRPLVVPMDTALPPFIILNCIRTLGVTRDEYLKWLAE